MTPSESQSPQPVHPPDRKGVLFCPDCAHDSPFDGDWVVTETSAFVTYRCPACDGLVQKRPVFEPETTATGSETQAAPQFGLAPAAVENRRQVWSSWTTAWLRFVTQARSR